MTYLLAVCSCHLALLSQVAGEEQSVRIEIPGAKTLVIEFPKDWKVQNLQPAPDLPPTLKVYPPNKADLSLQITLIPDKTGRFTSETDLKKIVELVNQRNLAGSVEKTLTLEKVSSKDGMGYFATLTDAALVGVSPLPAGKYLMASCGSYSIAGVAAAFTLLFNPTGAQHQKTALECLGKLREAPRPAIPAPVEGPLSDDEAEARFIQARMKVARHQIAAGEYEKARLLLTSLHKDYASHALSKEIRTLLASIP